MILHGRTSHRRVWTIFAITMPLLFLGAIWVRPPLTDPLAAPLILTEAFENQSPKGRKVSSHLRLGSKQALGLEVFHESVQQEAQYWVRVSPSMPVLYPDVLVYWTEAKPSMDSLKSAFLLGRLEGLSPRTFAWPPVAARKDGYIVLYSLGHRQIVDSAKTSSSWTVVERAQ